MLLGRLQVPSTVARGEVFEIRVLVQHPMETGFRRDFDGRAVPLNILDRLVCRYGGDEVFSAQLGTGMAANPYVSFFARAEAGGEVVVEWSDDHGDTGRATASISVT